MKPITVEELIDSLKAFPGHCKVYVKPALSENKIDPHPVIDAKRINMQGQCVVIITD
jgi:hypothetical protein